MRVALGDGIADVITGAGPYPVGFTGGVVVAAADLNEDGKADIITGAGPGGGGQGDAGHTFYSKPDREGTAMGTRALAQRCMLAFTMTSAAVTALEWPAPASAAVRVVTDCGDTGGVNQLRNQVAIAASGDTIILPACTITLASTLTIFFKTLAIAGAGASRTALDGGGAVRVLFVSEGSIGLSGLTIQNGNAGNDDGGGLLVFTSGLAPFASTTLSHVVVSGNRASIGGGIANLGFLTLLDSVVTGNMAATGSGGIANAAGALTLINSTISGNSAGLFGGGGLGNGNASSTVLNSTIVGNSAGTEGGGIAQGGGSVTLQNTLVANNVAPAGANCVATGVVITSLGHNLDSGNTCGFQASLGDVVNTNPLLGPLQNNGGPTPTHALLPGSPAIDAGGLGCPPTDQREARRPLDGSGDGVALCDIGAFEFNPAPPLLVTGAGAGGGPHVRVFNAATGQEVIGFFPYPAGFTGGARVAMGDVNGDGIPDLITGAGPGGGPHVQVFDGAALLKGQLINLYSFFAYAAGFTGGVFVAPADLNGDGKADIITGAGPGGGPHVQVFDGATGANLASPVGSFFAYDPAFMGGVFVGGAP